MLIAGFVKNSLIDFPGFVASVVFVPGCNFDCFFCHNRALLDDTGPNVAEDQVFGFLKRRAGMLDAVVVSGGEPTLQRGLIPFLSRVRELGYKTKLDTNGSFPRVVREILEKRLCDYFAVDYKAPAARYREICGDGADAQTVLETISILKQSHADFEVRTTVIPQLSKDDLIQMARELPPLPRYVLNRYRTPQRYRECDKHRVLAKPYSGAEIANLAAQMASFQKNIFF